MQREGLMGAGVGQGCIDRLGRRIDYVRLSVTDRCNLRCIYCMPEEGVPPKQHAEILRFEEIVLLVKAALNLGIDKIRLTGGEPLARRGIVELVEMIRACGVTGIAMTTNGTLLPDFARSLKEAGLKRVNISLDTLKPDRFERLARRPLFHQVMRGIEAAVREGLHPVKINVVPIRGFNDDEIEDFARLTWELPVHVRFIELMPIGEGVRWSSELRVDASEITRRLIELGKVQHRVLEPLDAGGPESWGPARTVRYAGAPGTLGIIDPETGEVLPPGEEGELVITTITKEAFPLLRYRTRDITRFNPEPCPCGRTHRRIRRITGRTDDMLIIRGVNVFPSQVESVLLEFGEAAPHYLLVVDRKSNLDRLEIWMEVSGRFFSDQVRHLEELESRLRERIESVLGISAAIRLVEPNTIPRSEGKAKRIVDRREI